MTKPQQLLLDLPHRPALGRDDFLVTGSNSAAVALIDDWPQWPSHAAILVGPRGSGKSHLSNVWQQASNAKVLGSADLTSETVDSMLDRNALARRFPTMRLGDEVAGASLGELDGHVNPLKLLAALQTAYLRRGGELRSNHAVKAIRQLPGGGFEVLAGDYRASAERVVIAAGLGSSALGPMVGLDVPLRPLRGQILVTERLAPLLPIPASGLRQTGEGTVMIGVTQEDVGFDLATTTEGAVRMTRKALRILPQLAQAKLVRQWACLRVMTPDGHPVYASSASHPGAEITTCHSGVTLASFHAGSYARALADGALPASLRVFHHERFHVPQIQ